MALAPQRAPHQRSASLVQTSTILGLRALNLERCRRAEQAMVAHQKGLGGEQFRLIAGAFQAHRKSSRAKLGPLTSHCVAPRTRNRYCQAYGRFVDLLVTFSLMLSCIADVDSFLSK